MLKERQKQDGDVLLSDGTWLSQLIDRDRREVSLRVHHDPEIFELEMTRIFQRHWFPVAHETEIPNSGDYVRRYIGQDSCLVVRDQDGSINVLLNVCTHRGMSLCREEAGNTKQFRCPYHGYLFDTKGNFEGAPFERAMYGEILRAETGRYALIRAQSASMHGLIFANWDADAEPFDAYLGDFKWYLDAVFKRTNGGLVAIGPPQRSIMRANWKLLAEQLPDGYHVMALHGSLADLGVIGQPQNDPAAWGLIGINASTPTGHTLRCIDVASTFGVGGGNPNATVAEKLAMAPPPGTDPKLTEEFVKNLTEGQMKLLAETPPLVLGLFPGTDVFAIMNHDGTDEGGLGPVMIARGWIPTAPDQFEMLSWILVERDASDELRDLTRRTTVRAFGISGVTEQDDAEAWKGIQRSVSGPKGRSLTAKYRASLGVNRPSNFEGGGDVYAGFSRDDAQWAWWNAYFNAMTLP
jgi:phenylpropionate dioxygenase-like ring-hydroxylating dioxygenase large terminal subunit